MAKRKNNRKRKPQLPPTEAQRKKAFMRRLVRVAKSAGAEEALRWIPSQDVDKLYFTRYRAVRVEAADDNVPIPLLKAVREQLDGTLQETILSLKEGCPSVTLKEYLSVAMPLYYYITGTNDRLSTCAPIVREQFSMLVEAVDEELELSPLKMVAQVAGLIGMDITRIHRRLYWFNHQVRLEGTHLFDCLYMHAEYPKKQKILLSDGLRLVYKVGWAFPNVGMQWPKVTGKDFGFNNKHSHKPVHVYIQAHAINRLKERLDVINVSHIHFYLSLALARPRVVRTKSGRLLIEYYYNQKKFGYLVFDLAGNKIVVKTFLFLTMDGTPEGEKLREMLGIEAVDKKYLEIDRLSTFILTDIKDDPEMLEKFKQAGCADLFMLDNEEIKNLPRIERAVLMHSYLRRPSQVLPAAQEEDMCDSLACVN